MLKMFYHTGRICIINVQTIITMFRITTLNIIWNSMVTKIV